ncbi:MAG TPA: class I SAM-dependent methyltransferase, partial [Candidatus Tectomicrobia bacterium]
MKDMDLTAKGFGEQWQRQAKGGFERGQIYGQTAAQELAEFQSFLDIASFDDLDGKLILDAGCGPGRLTENVGKAAPEATVIGIDISDAVKVARERSKTLPNVHIIKCDLRRPPFKFGTFDYVWSDGVIHHTPDTHESFRSIDQLVKKGGKLYIWVYSDNFSPYQFIRDLLGKPYRLPPFVRYGLAVGIGLAYWSLRVVMGVLGIRPQLDNLKTTIFRLYDSFASEYQWRH